MHVDRMVERLGIPQSTVSQHLRILQDRGILRPRRDGVRTCYIVIDTRVRRIVEMLEQSAGRPAEQEGSASEEGMRNG